MNQELSENGGASVSQNQREKRCSGDCASCRCAGFDIEKVRKEEFGLDDDGSSSNQVSSATPEVKALKSRGGAQQESGGVSPR